MSDRLDAPLVAAVADAIAQHLYIIAETHPRKWKIETADGTRRLTRWEGDVDIRELALRAIQVIEDHCDIELVP